MKIIVALALLLTPVAAQASDHSEWTFVTRTKSGSISYVLTEDMMRGGSTSTKAKAWVKTDHSRDATTPVRQSKILFEINCRNQTYKVLTLASTFPNGKRESDTPAYPSTRYIVPDTIMDAVAEAVCSDTYFDPVTSEAETPLRSE